MATQIRLLGAVELLEDGRVLPLAGKERNVFALLAVRRNERVSEDHLVDALWGEAPPRTARRTLHAYLSRLRRTLAGSRDVRIDTVDHGYRLVAPEGTVDEDLVHRALADAGRLRDRARAAELLAGAEARWYGDSLGQLAAEPALHPDALRLETLRRSITEERIVAELDGGRHVEVIGELQRLTTAEPLRERPWHLLMLALYRAGRQAEALRAYQDVRGVLADELGLEPSPDLRQLEQAILDQDEALAWRPVGEPGSSPPPGDADWIVAAANVSAGVPLARMLQRRSRVPCVGRQSELDRLRAIWAGCREGQPAVALVAGAPGVGKTRLAAEVARQAREEGALVLYGAADDSLVVPYQPFAEALGHLTRHVPGSLLEPLLGPGAGELTHLVPNLSALVPSLPDRTVSEPETERFRLFQAVTGWVESTAAAQPLVLILDDLHWAGPGTLGMFAHLVRQLAAGPALIIGTYRDTEVSLNPTLGTVLADLRRLDEVARMTVENLDERGSEALVAAVAGMDLGAEERQLAGVVHRETDGNPFFIQEVLRHLVDTGRVVTADDGSWLRAQPVASIGLPDSVREVVRRRLDRLPERAHAVLAAAAVIGSDIPYDILGEIVGLDDLGEVMESVIEAGLVEDASDSVSLRYRFTHALVQAALYQDLPAPVRTRLHAEVAGAFGRHTELSGVDHSQEQAHHYVRAVPAGYGEQALTASIAAGEVTLAALVFEVAARHFLQALELVGDRPILRIGILLGLAEARFRQGHSDFRSPLEEAWVLAGATGEFELVERAALACARGYWGNFAAIDGARVAILEQALELCPASDAIRRARLQADLAVELIWGDSDTRTRYTRLADEALAVARQTGDPTVLATILARRLTTFWSLDRNAERRSLAIEGLELATALGDPVLQVQFITHGIFCAVESADPDRLEPLKALLDGLTGTIGQPIWEYSIHYALCNYHTVRNGPKEIEACAQRALELGTAMELKEAPFLYLCEIGDVHWWRDTYEEVVELIEPIVNDYAELVTMQTWLAAIFARTDRRAQAQAILDRFSATGFDVGDDYSRGIALAECALAAADLGDRRAARTLLGILEPYRDLVLRNPINAAGPTTWFLARLHDVLGETAAADAAWDEAERTAELMGARLWQAHLACDRAEALARRPGGEAEARVRAARAVDLAVDLDLPGILHRAERLIEVEARSPL